MAAEQDERWNACCLACGEEFQVLKRLFFTAGASKITCLRCGRDTLVFSPPKPDQAPGNR